MGEGTGGACLGALTSTALSGLLWDVSIKGCWLCGPFDTLKKGAHGPSVPVVHACPPPPPGRVRSVRRVTGEPGTESDSY